MRKQTEIEEVLIQRDGLSPEEAFEALCDARADVEAGADPEEVLRVEFGLEPDYIFDLIEGA